MNNQRKSISQIFNNGGSTLITVIVAIAFVTILVSIILGTTVVNVRMKGIDKRTKDDFYYAEKALNDIYIGIGQELSIKAGDEYEKAFEKIGDTSEKDSDTGKTIDYNLAETAEREFRKAFLAEVFGLFPTSEDARKDMLNDYITSSSRNERVEKPGTIEYQKKDGSHTDKIKEAYRVAIKGIEVSATDSSGYRSVISTDIIINAPTVDFLGTNADVSDYGLIANGGLYIDGGYVDINGNVYAGVHEGLVPRDSDFKELADEFSKDNIYGGINIKNSDVKFSGNYIISKGDINLAGDSNPSIKVFTPSVDDSIATNRANLWFTSLRTISGTKLPNTSTSGSAETTIDLDANVFALNDLILNADNSSVNIQGNYYGYNDKGSLSGPFLGDIANRDDAKSSAIIINGSHAYLNMEKVENFVLMGKAYIDFTSDPETKSDAMNSLPQVVKTAEGVALKTNQQLYLAPPDFLDGPNPTTEGTGNFGVSIGQSDLEKWFGYSYLAPSPGPTDIGTPYTVTMTDGTKAYYYYLKFKDDHEHPVNWEPKKEESITALPSDTDTVKYIVTSDGTVYKYTRNDDVSIGTHGGISSQAMFFLKVMTSRSTYEFRYNHGGKSEDGGYSKLEDYISAKESGSDIIQPSAYRLWERIDRSMGWDYFDLKQCIIGNQENIENAHYYAKNAVVNYNRTDEIGEDGVAVPKFRSNVFNNTEGMLRYSYYPTYLFNRYVLLCTELNGCEEKLLDENPGTKDPTNPTEWIEWTDFSKDAPFSKYVMKSNIATMNIGGETGSINKAESEDGLKRGAYGVVIATDEDLIIDGSFPGLVSNTFMGVAIVDGDITVKKGYNVTGLLMATGTITIEGNDNSDPINHPENNTKINYDKGLIQSRIEKEMNLVKNDKDSSDWDSAIAGKDYYLIRYLTDKTGDYKYKVEPGSKIKRERIEADYNDFMHYENWQKGENDATPTPTTTPTTTPTP